MSYGFRHVNIGSARCRVCVNHERLTTGLEDNDLNSITHKEKYKSDFQWLH